MKNYHSYFFIKIVFFICYLNGSAQCDFSKINALIIGSCINDNSGSIKLDGLENILVGPINIAACDSGGLISGNNIVVNPGETKRIETTAWANITINGGKLIICGSVTTLNLSLSNGGTLINNGSFAAYGDVNIPSECAIINNFGSVAFYSKILVKGTLLNLNGTMATYATLSADNGGEILNNSTFYNASQGNYLTDNYDEKIASSCIITWSGLSQEGSYITNLSPGVYTANISSGGCTISKSFTVPIRSPLKVDVSANQNTDSLCNGSLLATAYSGIPPYYYIWANTDGQTISLSETASFLCSGKYTLTIIDDEGCYHESTHLIMDNITTSTIPDESSDSLVNDDTTNQQIFHLPLTTEIEDTPQINDLSKILSKSGQNQLWDISGIDITKFKEIEFDDKGMESSFSLNSLLNNFSIEYGFEKMKELPSKIYSGNVANMKETNTIKIIVDATGNIKINNDTISNFNRIHVQEVKKFFCISNCMSIPDTSIIIIDSYYWIREQDISTPILTYRETSSEYMHGSLREFHQEIIQNTLVNNEIDDFINEVNLRLNPNPVIDNVNVSYNLPIEAHVVISIDNSSSGTHTIVRDQNQSGGNYSFIYDTSTYMPGIYNVNLNINGILIGRTMIITR